MIVIDNRNNITNHKKIDTMPSRVSSQQHDVYHNILSNMVTFNKFHHYIKDLTPIEKGTCFELLTKYIFLLHPYYKSTTKNIWMYNDIPSHIITLLNLPNKDKGIDLLLETTNNQYHPIQCKYRANTKETVKWGDLGTFVGLTFGICDFTNGYLVTNTDTLNEEIIKSKKIISLYGDFFDTIDKEFLRTMKSYITTNKFYNRYNSHEQRMYQTEFVNKCVERFVTDDRAYANICCGGGKTLMCYWLYKQMNCNNAIIGVPSLYLLSQFYKK